jgi:hypothetical protein
MYIDVDSILVKKSPARTRNQKSKQNVQQEDNLTTIPVKKSPARMRTRKTKQNLQQEDNSTTTPVKNSPARVRTRKTKQNLQQEDNSTTPVKEIPMRKSTQKKNQKQNAHKEENLRTTRNMRLDSAQKSSKYSSSSDDDDDDDSNATSALVFMEQRKSEPHVLLDDEPTIIQDYGIAGSSNSFTLPTNNHVQTMPQEIMFSQKDPSMQELLLQKKPEKIQHEIEDIAIDLQPKQPTQFQNMSNDFEIAHWVACHKKVLELAISIQNGMMSSADEEHDKPILVSSSSKQRISLEPVLTPLEIEQVIKVSY